MNDPRLTEISRRLDELERRMRTVSDTTQKVGDRVQRTVYSQVEALIGLYRDLDGLPSLPPLRSWAVSPDAARVLHDLIRTHRPRHVVECGTGASTVMLGHLRMAGLIEQVTSIDHDPVYLEMTRQRLRTAGLLGTVELRLAELAERTTDDRTAPWYSVDADQFAPIDMVLVDGPPASTGPQARYPALPVLAPAMNPGCLIVIDDYQRTDEAEMVEAWRKRYPVELSTLDRTVEKALAALEYRPDGSSPTPNRSEETEP